LWLANIPPRPVFWSLLLIPFPIMLITSCFVPFDSCRIENPWVLITSCFVPFDSCRIENPWVKSPCTRKALSSYIELPP
jgi:hypothetical protein